MLHRPKPLRPFPNIEDWTIVRAATPRSAAGERLVWADDTGCLSVSTDPAAATNPIFTVTFDDVASFRLSFATREMHVSLLDDDVSDTTIDHLLVDQIWPRLLAHGGDLVVHAAGVSDDQGTLLFVGQSGRGKSTLAASFHQHGMDLLGDDAMVMSMVDGAARCRAVYRSLRLFPDSITSIFPAPVRRSEVAEYTDKENVHLPLVSGQDGDPRVRALFFIEPGGRDDCVSVRPLAPGDACMRLVEHSFWLDPTDLALTARKLEAASALAGSVRAYQLSYPRDYSRLGQVHDAIFAVLD